MLSVDRIMEKPLLAYLWLFGSHGGGRICAWHKAPASRLHYLFRLNLTANVKRAIAAVPERDWQGPARLGVLQAAELTGRFFLVTQ